MRPGSQRRLHGIFSKSEFGDMERSALAVRANMRGYNRPSSSCPLSHQTPRSTRRTLGTRVVVIGLGVSGWARLQEATVNCGPAPSPAVVPEDVGPSGAQCSGLDHGPPPGSVHATGATFLCLHSGSRGAGAPIRVQSTRSSAQGLRATSRRAHADASTGCGHGDSTSQVSCRVSGVL